MSKRRKGLSFYQRKKKVSPKIVKESFGWIVGMLIAMFAAGVAAYFLGMTTKVVGVSMEKELYNGQKVLLNRFVYLLSAPKRGDVIAFLPNGNENSHYYIKRVIAVPGDKVWISKGIIYINGIPSEWVEDKILESGIAENEIVLGNGEFFCMGDNVNYSEDSRSPNIGPVNREDIVGRVWFCFKHHLRKMGFVNRHI